MPSTSPEGQGTSPPDRSAAVNGHSRPACTECQRRKQKCNRQWPCNHCQKRKVADQCRFTQAPAAADKSPAATKKRSRHDEDVDMASDDDDDMQGFAAIGYMHSDFLSGLTSEKKPRPTPRQYFKAPDACPQLQKALQVLPSRTTTDVLVQNFLSRVNFHYYIIYPPSFLQEYRDWWADRQANKPLGLQWTCLLLMICACSAQYTEPGLQRKIETELGEAIEYASDRYHLVARELHSTIPVSYSHLISVQYLLHSCLWYKYEARFVESWHVLSVAIREAQELCFNHEKRAGPISEFDAEMRRRTWCIMDTWDWQISALLSRPRIIDLLDCDVQQPSLTLEGYAVSPMEHMKQQSIIVGQLSARFGAPKNATSPSDINEYLSLVEDWIQTFPPQFDVETPDKSLDSKYEWIILHRHYLHSACYWMLLDPLRPYLTRAMDQQSLQYDLHFRAQGIKYGLKLVRSLIDFFHFVYPNDAKFHFVLFSVFDIASTLCSTMLHDDDGSLDSRNDIAAGVRSAIDMLSTLQGVTKTAKASHDILLLLMQRVAAASEAQHQQPVIVGASPNHSQHHGHHGMHDQQPNGGVYATMPPQPMMMTSLDMGQQYMPIAPQSVPVKVPTTMYLQPLESVYMAPTPTHMFGNFSLDGFTEEQLGDLATMWNYQSLDLSFIPQQQQQQQQ
ncbi:hypothetical protein VHEMI07579 [[Torrubiella] hemipterigena]|uniref:Zn(2)-C6 fungal-type domain-containing protein n=1 Tax=[Torrubiella] hemipterigena TaxID=1531966 RepID=A0A0A1TLK8_9HYPO|nr:hypothetical protein VHEMI07579 [[Torrubiella] hemipterigena]